MAANMVESLELRGDPRHTRCLHISCVLRGFSATCVRVRQVAIVGHALHHDLKALRLDYRPVIDTSLLFSYR